MGNRARRVLRPELESFERRELLSGVSGLATGGFPSGSDSVIVGTTPTTHEINRQAFRAGFSGRYYQGPGRFTDQGTTYLFRGLGSSSAFVHGDLAMAVVTPADPNAPFVGEAVMNDKNWNSASILGLSLSGDRSAVDSQGRPTQLTYVSNTATNAGTFGGSSASGTATIRYGTTPNSPATVTFRGSLYTSGIADQLINMDLYARGGRPLRFRR